MSLFALYCLLDDHDVYRTKMQRSCSTAPGQLWKSLGWTAGARPERRLLLGDRPEGVWATRLYGADFFTWLKKNYDSLDIVVHDSPQDTGVVLMDGHGFDAPNGRCVSLANLNADDYRHRPAPLGHARRVRRGMEDGEVAATSSATMRVPVSPRRPAAAWAKVV